jgi:hypothetical protein
MPTMEGKRCGMAQSFGLAAPPPLLRRGPLREWLCISARAAKLGAGGWALRQLASSVYSLPSAVRRLPCAVCRPPSAVVFCP